MANRKLGDFVPEVKKALDEGMQEHLEATQAALANANPIDTGRMASSWFINKSAPATGERPPDWAAPGAKKLVIEEYTGLVEFDGTWYITNNLPYAVRVATDPEYAKGGPGGVDWYTRIVNQQPADLVRRLRKHLARVR